MITDLISRLPLYESQIPGAGQIAAAMPHDGIYQRTGKMACSRMDHHALWFIDNEKVIVFI